jgi:hypothetical protein
MASGKRRCAMALLVSLRRRADRGEFLIASTPVLGGRRLQPSAHFFPLGPFPGLPLL